MTDRERLLKQVREAEYHAENFGGEASAWMYKPASAYDCDKAITNAIKAAHHGLTALVLRDAIKWWEKCEEDFSLSEYKATPGL